MTQVSTEEVDSIRNARVRNLAANGLGIAQMPSITPEEASMRLQAQGLGILVSRRQAKRVRS